VYDVRGCRILDLTPQSVSADGEGVAVWDLRDAQGHRVGGGVYLARMELQGRKSAPSFVKRFVVLP